MSKYYNVDKVRTTAKRVARAGDNHPSVRDGRRLVAIADNGLFKAAIDVTEQSEFDYFYARYYSGGYLTFELYDYNPLVENKKKQPASAG